MGLLEERLTHGSHCLLVFTYLLRNANEHAKLRWKVDILTFLFNFEKRLVQRHYLLIILLAEVLHHRNGLAGLTLLKTARFWAHVPAHCRHLVGFVVTIAGHDDGVLELVVDCLLHFVLLWDFACVALALLRKTNHLLVNQLEAVVDRKILGNVIDDKIDTTLKDPRARKEAGPSLHGIVEDLCL